MTKLDTSELLKNLETMAIAMKAQGFETSVKPMDYPAITVTGWLIYGARRWFQDHVNSVAKNHRDNDENFSGEDLFSARNKMAKAGDWGSRGSGSGLDPEIAIMLNATLRVSTGKKVWAKMKAEAQRDASVAMWESLDEETQTKWNTVATARKVVKEEQRKALANIQMPELKI